MPINYFDTSAIAKHYHVESGSISVDTLLLNNIDVHVISRFAFVEFHLIMAKKVRVGQLPERDFQRITRKFRGDIRSRKIRVLRSLVSHFQLAQRLIQKHSLTSNLRTLDSLQLAVALGIPSSSVVRFICADKSLCSVAGLEGFHVMNPEIPLTTP